MLGAKGKKTRKKMTTRWMWCLSMQRWKIQSTKETQPQVGEWRITHFTIQSFAIAAAHAPPNSSASTSTSKSKTNFEDMLSSARNLGQSSSSHTANSAAFGMDGMTPSHPPQETGAPVMIIPQLAPVRFPKNGDLIEGNSSGPVDLDGGESDADDEKARWSCAADWRG